MINISNRLEQEKLESKMLLQVHDELLFEVPEKEKEVMSRLVREEMEHAVKLEVPLKVDMGMGSNWAEAH
jgi:DNA polymerase-1